MIDIEITRQHAFNPSELPVKVYELIQELEKEFHLEATWRNDYLAVEFVSNGGFTKGIVGNLEFDQLMIKLEVQLPFGLKPMKHMIKKTIIEYMDQCIQQESL